MEQQLTDEKISQICMFMRVIDTMKSNPDVLNENAEMNAQFEKIIPLVNQMMEALTEEQRDIVLEEHKRQLEELRKNSK